MGATMGRSGLYSRLHRGLNRLRGRFSTRLMAGLLLLVLATTLSAGLPAYWLTSTQLQAQAWAGVSGAEAATDSLLQAARTRLSDMALLFAERPTLRLLLAEGTGDELEQYMVDFKQQSDIDLLLVCDGEGRARVGDTFLDVCPAAGVSQFALIDRRPALLAAEAVSALAPATAVAGLWLDDAFMQELSGTTAALHSVITPDGQRVAATLPNARAQPWPVALGPGALDAGGGLRQMFELDGEPYYASLTLLTEPGSSPALYAEVALPVRALRQTERRALGILIASTGLIALLGVLLGVVSIRRLTRPLHELTTASESIALGNLTAPIPVVQSPAEVATLARALAASRESLLDALAERSQARDWLAALINSIVEGVIIFDAEGSVTFFSQGAETLSGWPSSQAVGMSIDELFPPRHAEEGSFRRALPAPGQRRRMEVLHRDGHTIALAITGTQLAPLDATASGGALETALVVRDVTGAEALDQIHAYFLANLTHEFQTPLSTLHASLELLQEHADELAPDELRALLQPAYLSLLGLQNLVNNLLASSAIEAGRFSVRLRPTNINQVIADALGLVQPLLDRRKQLLTLEEPSAFAGYPEIQADGTRLTLALVNLLTNASKYSPSGATIDLAIDVNPTRLRIGVADRGPGLSPEARSQLFNRFVRLHAPESEQRSTGLGLFVVKTTVEAHGGHVGIDDRPGGGTVFWIELPMRAAEELHEDSDRGRRPGPVRRPSIYASPRRLRGRSGL